MYYLYLCTIYICTWNKPGRIQIRKAFFASPHSRCSVPTGSRPRPEVQQSPRPRRKKSQYRCPRVLSNSRYRTKFLLCTYFDSIRKVSTDTFLLFTLKIILPKLTIMYPTVYTNIYIRYQFLQSIILRTDIYDFPKKNFNSYIIYRKTSRILYFTNIIFIAMKI